MTKQNTYAVPALAGPAFRRARAEAIGTAVGLLHGFTLDELRAPGGEHPRADVRQLAMWAQRQITNEGDGEISAFYGRERGASFHARRPNKKWPTSWRKDALQHGREAVAALAGSHGETAV